MAILDTTIDQYNHIIMIQFVSHSMHTSLLFVSVHHNMSSSFMTKFGYLYILPLTLTYCLKKNGDISGGGLVGCGLSNEPLTLADSS